MSKMEFRDRPIILTDVETTGLDPRVHEIVDIGAVKVDHNLNVLQKFSCKVFPLQIETAQPAALEINGYHPDDWHTSVSPYRAAVAFADFAADGILAAWNITFEYGFLQALGRGTHTNLLDKMDYHRIDLPSIAWLLLPELQKLSLDKVGEYFGLPAEEKPHTGLRGAEYELEVLRFLKGKTI